MASCNCRCCRASEHLKKFPMRPCDTSCLRRPGSNLGPSSTCLRCKDNRISHSRFFVFASSTLLTPTIASCFDTTFLDSLYLVYIEFPTDTLTEQVQSNRISKTRHDVILPACTARSRRATRKWSYSWLSSLRTWSWTRFWV